MIQILGVGMEMAYIGIRISILCMKGNINRELRRVREC